MLLKINKNQSKINNCFQVFEIFQRTDVCPERTDKGQMGSGRFFDRFFGKKKSFFWRRTAVWGQSGFLWMLLELMVEGVNIFNHYPPVPSLMKSRQAYYHIGCYSTEWRQNTKVICKKRLSAQGRKEGRKEGRKKTKIHLKNGVWKEPVLRVLG